MTEPNHIIYTTHSVQLITNLSLAHLGLHQGQLLTHLTTPVFCLSWLKSYFLSDQKPKQTQNWTELQINELIIWNVHHKPVLLNLIKDLWKSLQNLFYIMPS